MRITGNRYTDIYKLLMTIRSWITGIVIVDIELSRGINITFMRDAIVRSLNVCNIPNGMNMCCQIAGRASRSGALSCSVEYIIANDSTNTQEDCYKYQRHHDEAESSTDHRIFVAKRVHTYWQ